MKIAIIAGKTGNGHISVMKSLNSSFLKKGIIPSLYSSFYEDLTPSNKIMSDFYNYLTVSSIEVCCKLSELSYITKPDQTDDYYAATRDKIRDFILSNSYDVIVSTIHSVNHVFLKNLEEMQLRDKIKYYIVITDPYIPISQGFDVNGADHYFATTVQVQKYLERKGIAQNKISLVSYPLDEKFIYPITAQRFSFAYPNYPTLLLNSGSQGIFSYFSYLKTIVSVYKNLNIVFICGKNKNLEICVKDFVERKNLQGRVLVMGFIDNMHEVMKSVDFIITKPGANSVFEAIALQKPLIIEGLNGFLFQEQGIVEFIEQNPFGEIVKTESQLISSIGNYMNKENRKIKVRAMEKNLFHSLEQIIYAITYWRISRHMNHEQEFKLHHIGYAVRSIPKTALFFSEVFGYSVIVPTFVFTQQDVKICMLKHPQSEILIELVEGISDFSPIARHLDYFNGGAYHLCYKVNNLEQSCIFLKERKFTQIQKTFMENENFKAIYMLTPENQLIEFIQEK